MGRTVAGIGLVCAAAVGGCAGATGQLRNENRVLGDRVAELRASGRRDRNHIRDLENQVFLLRDQLETAEVGRDRDRSGRPTLPVEVVAPAPDGGGGETDVLSAGDDDDYRVVGVDQDGVEIVYAGEAARDHGPRPALRLDDGDGFADADVALASDDYSVPDDDRRATRNARRPLRPLRAGGDRAPSGKSDKAQRRDRADTDADDPVSSDKTDRSAQADRAGGDAIAEYQRYVSALRAGNHAYAITGFRNFLAQHRDHDYADNAQYWLGEAYYDQKDYQRALTEFRTTVEKYPDGNKVPDALLKAGFCYAALGELASARTVLEQVIAIYPKSGPAALAATRLAELSDRPSR